MALWLLSAAVSSSSAFLPPQPIPTIVSHRPIMRQRSPSPFSLDRKLQQHWMTETSSSRSRSDEPVAASMLSTSELLKELDRKNIRYPPTASRMELERLLDLGNNSSSSNPTTTTPTESSSNKSAETQQRSDIAGMVKELMAMGVRLPSHASRADLERLLEEQRQRIPGSDDKERTSSFKKLRNRRRKRKYNAIPRLLIELDELGIPYPPGASPAILERLLRTYDDNDDDEQEESIIPPPRRRRRNSSGRDRRTPETERVRPAAPEPFQNEPIQKSTAELLDELNRRGVRFAPTATREDLETLLKEEEYSQSSPELVREQQQHPQRIMNEETEDDDGDDGGGDPFVDSDLVQPNPTVRDIQIISESNGNKSGEKTIYTGRQQLRTRRKMTSREASVWSKLYGTGKKTVKRGVFETIPKYIAKTSDGATTRLSDVADRAARRARYAKRSAGDFWMQDEDGIRDVDFQYISKEDIPIIDVAAEAIDVESTTSADRRRQRQRPKEDFDAAYSSTERISKRNSPYSDGQSTLKTQDNIRRRRPSSPSMPKRRRPPGATRRSRPKRNQAGSGAAKPPPAVAVESSLFRLPPAKDIAATTTTDTAASNEGSIPTGKQSSPRTKSRATQTESRRIYSPYDEIDLPSQVYRDSIDRFAEFFANTTDTILWGRLDDDDDDQPETSKPKAPKKKSTKQSKSKASSKSDRRTMKDRVEERFDSMLGIHEKGEYYNRWAKNDDKEDLQEGGSDAVSYARGQTSKKKRRGRRNKVYDKPFWDTENMFSSFFGRSPPVGYSGVGIGNLLPAIKALGRSFVIFSGNACEWATVRGALPQPVVVVGVTSCVLSARPGKRLLAMGVSLLVFRILGELIHEGLYGDDDWEEEDDDDEDEFEEE